MHSVVWFDLDNSSPQRCSTTNHNGLGNGQCVLKSTTSNFKRLKNVNYNGQVSFNEQNTRFDWLLFQWYFFLIENR